MNSGVYRYICLFSLLLAQFVYPPPGKAQSSANIPLVTTTLWQKQEDHMESRLPGKLAAEMKKIVGGLASWRSAPARTHWDVYLPGARFRIRSCPCIQGI